MSSTREVDFFGLRRLNPSPWDLVAIVLVIGFVAFLASTSRELLQPLAHLEAVPLSLDPIHLPEYAARTTVRMLVALAFSLLFALGYATWAAKNARAGKLLVPILDVLQSVPILGFISITVVFFLTLGRGRVLGAEMAAIFAIFTSQAWNMAFSVYQSLRTVPVELREAADSFHLTPWMRFWQLEVPFATPPLVWNMMMSMSGGWFFVVAAEAITVGNTTFALPGIGSYIALAIEQRNLAAIGWAIATMLVVILLYDQLLFRPLVAWMDRFRIDQDPGAEPPRSWVLSVLRRSQLAGAVRRAAGALFRWSARPRRALPMRRAATEPRRARRSGFLALVLVIVALAFALRHIAAMLIEETSLAAALEVGRLALLTMTRVFVLIALASVIWVPVGVWVGLRPRAAAIVQPVAQFLAAFPANLLFPLVVYGIVSWRLDANVWLSPLMILGTQWYILFNVIVGASAMPNELRYAADNLHVGGWLWWRKVALPGVFPYYVTGVITASGGSWNASIVAEVASWGDMKLEARGLGAYIADATAAGDLHRVALGIATMCLFVVVINRALWTPLYDYAERKFRLT
ncbi:MAG TPA: ABC transporter permease subunit [Gammaproteobacteria bacterium]|nr:ABC transporter permease subunit [Gammaproteobacteria bacterium]